MDKLIEILKEALDDDIDFEKETALFDDGYLTSFALLTITSDIQDEFDVTFTPMDIIPENFNSVQAMWALIQSKQGK